MAMTASTAHLLTLLAASFVLWICFGRLPL